MDKPKWELLKEKLGEWKKNYETNGYFSLAGLLSDVNRLMDKLEENEPCAKCKGEHHCKCPF